MNEIDCVGGGNRTVSWEVAAHYVLPMLGLIVAMAAFSAVAQQPPSKTSEFTLWQDRFAAGDQVTIAESIGGDLIAAALLAGTGV